MTTTTTIETPVEMAVPGGNAGAAVSARVRDRLVLARTSGLVGTLTVGSLALTVMHLWPMQASMPGRIPWWLLAVCFGLAEVLVFHIEVRREAISFTLSEVPLTLGLLFASPLALIVGRLIGEAVLLALIERQQARRVLTNLAVFFAECATAVTVFHALPGDHQLNHPGTWGAALAAVAAADALGLTAIVIVMRWHGAPVEPARMALTNAVTAVTNTAIAVLAAVLLDTNVWAAALLMPILAIIVTVYRGYSSLSRRYASLELLYEFTRLVSGSKRPDVVLASMLAEAKRLLRADAAAILTISEGEQISLWLGPDDAAARPRRLPLDMLRALVVDRRAVVIDKHTSDRQRRSILDMLGVADCIIAPLVEASELIGVLLVADRHTTVSTFDADDARIFETLANHAGVALENGRLIDRLHEQARQREYEALHDSLTELPNRADFLHRLNATIVNAGAGKGRVGVGLLDLDHFKEVNDTLGHHHGDLLLREVAARLRATLPATITLARLGGDEFGLFTEHNTSAAGLIELGNAIRDSFMHPFWVEEFGLEVGASIGFALFPDHGADPATLLQRADVAMYDAKSASTNRIEIYDPKRDVNSPRRLALASDLRAAIEARDLTLHYQPKIRLSDGVVHSVEGLIRWRHATYGNVPPDDFVPLAERTGLIHPFTDFVIEHGMAQLGAWNNGNVNVEMSLNLSTRNLLDASLPARIERILANAAIEPARVTFEITETAIMSEPDKTIPVLHSLAELGVLLSIDDFGTGHSSLAYLQRLPIHEVKIDKSFVLPLTTDPSARAIVQSIIQLAHNLDLNVVAEGIEDEATLTELQYLGCDHGQGYHLCRPIPAADFETWIADRPLPSAAPPATTPATTSAPPTSRHLPTLPRPDRRTGRPPTDRTRQAADISAHRHDVTSW